LINPLKFVTCLLAGTLAFALHPGQASNTGATGDMKHPYTWSHNRLQDINPDPHIVEVNLIAAETEVELKPGVSTTVWAYNGTVPGPQIEANVGQTLIINFTNLLPEPTTIHMHGVELPANVDGNNIAQELIPPGGSFRYKFKVLNAATHWYHPHVKTNEQIEKGLYGPLLLRDPAQEKRVGIPKRRDFTLVVDDILLDDAGQISEFATDLSVPMSPIVRAEEIFNARHGNTFLVNGVELPTLKVKAGLPVRLRVISPANGRTMRLSIPGHTMYQIASDGGLLDEIVPIPPVELISDGAGGFISDPDPTQGLIVTPSERAEVVVIPDAEIGSELYVEWHDLPIGRHQTFLKPDGSIGFGDAEDDGKRPSVNILKLQIVDNDHDSDDDSDNEHRHYRLGWHPALPLRETPIEPIQVPEDAEPMPIFFGHMPPMPNGNVVFFNAVRNRDGLMAALAAKQAQAEDPTIIGPVPGMVGPSPFQPLPFNAVTAEDALDAEVGQVRVWYLVNFTGGDHTFHPHGFFFQPLETISVNLDGNTAAERVITTALPLQVKDSIRIERRSGSAGRSWTIIKAAVRFDDSANPPHLQRTPQQLEAFGKIPVTLDPLDPEEGTSGGWVSHCHLLDHADVGMMTFYNLRIPSGL